MATVLGDLLVKLKLDKGQFTAGLDEAKSSTGGLVKELGNLVTAAAVAQQAFSAFNDRLAEDTGFNRVVANMQRLDIYTPEAAASIAQLTSEMEFLGDKQTQLYAEMLPLLTLTRDVSQAMGLLRLAQQASVATGSPLTAVISAMTGAMQGQGRVVRPLLRDWGEWSAEVKTAGDLLEIVRRRAGEATTVLSQEALATLALKKSFADLKEEIVVAFGPGVTVVLQGLSAWLTVIVARVKETIAVIRGKAADVFDIEAEMEQRLQDIFYPGEALSGGSALPSWWNELVEQMKSVKLMAEGAGSEEKKAEKPPVFGPTNEELAELSDRYESWLALNMVGPTRDTLNELTELWRDHNKDLIALSDALSSRLTDALVDLPLQAMRGWKSFGDYLLNLLSSIASMVARTFIAPQVGAWVGGMLGTQAGGATGGASFGGSLAAPSINYAPAPVVVQLAVRGDVTRFAEFSEEVVRQGLRYGHAVGR